MNSTANSLHNQAELEIELRTTRIQKEAEEYWKNDAINTDRMRQLAAEGDRVNIVKSWFLNRAAQIELTCLIRSIHHWLLKTKDALSTQGIIALTDQATMRAREEITGQATHEIYQACAQVAEHTTAQAMEENLVVLHRQRVRSGCIAIGNIYHRLQSCARDAAFSYWKGFMKGKDKGDVRRRVDELDRILRISDLYRVRDKEITRDLENADSQTRLAIMLQYKHGYLSKPFLIWKEAVLMTMAMNLVQNHAQKEALLDHGALTLKSLAPGTLMSKWFHRWKVVSEMAHDRVVRDELKEEELEQRYHRELSEQRAHVEALVHELKRYRGLVDVNRLPTLTLTLTLTLNLIGGIEDWWM